jgi:hypothetical protein
MNSAEGGIRRENMGLGGLLAHIWISRKTEDWGSKGIGRP